MKKKLTEAEFEQAIKKLGLKRQTLEITKGVLVEGKPQSYFANEFQITNGAISQAVNRVWIAHKAQKENFQKISVILPNHQAFIAKKWAEIFKAKLKEKK